MATTDYQNTGKLKFTYSVAFLRPLLLAGTALFAAVACSDSDGEGRPGENDSTDNKGSSTISKEQVGEVVTLDDSNPDADSCDNVLKVVLRDFQKSHPDFERPNEGWGPLQGVLEDNLDADRKPVFRDIWGQFKIYDPECDDQCPNGGNINRDTAQKWGTQDNDYKGQWERWLADNPNPSDDTLANLWSPYVPMFDGRDAFDDWYHDSSRSKRVELALVLEQDGDSYVFDSTDFFPLDDNGYGDKDLNGHNYLFTTEVHLEFLYSGGEKFTFRGDDDLWIFVDGRIALDLGGMHWPFQGTIDFDQLGLTKDQSYHMDIFHAERHTSASNFRIETNIECFTSYIPEVE